MVTRWTAASRPRWFPEMMRARGKPEQRAYRGDRKKDTLLQEHGFFVLRFLAEDLARRLDEVLDAILRAN